MLAKRRLITSNSEENNLRTRMWSAPLRGKEEEEEEVEEGNEEEVMGEEMEERS